MKGLEFVLLGVGATLGAFLRYKLVESPLVLNTIPLNVLIVNVIGAFILGMFVIISQHWSLDWKYSMFAAVGFCGSLTTMSAFALDSATLLDQHHYYALAINIIANAGLSIGALLGGRAMMNLILN